MTDVRQQIRAGLQSQGLPAPTLSWIQSVLSNRSHPLPPLPALVASARARLLAADLTSPALLDASSPAPTLPAELAAANAATHVQQARLPRDVLVQVLDIDNLSKSKWEQVEELEAIARGEQTRGREIIRLSNPDDDGDDGGGGNGEVVADDASSTATQSVSNGSSNNNNRQAANSNRTGAAAPAAAAAAATPKNSTHRLVLQDCRGQKIHGLELRRIEKIGVATLHVGEKILLKKGAAVARGVVLLEPDTCVILGGKIEAWQKAWVEGRLARLKEAVGGGGGGSGSGGENSRG